MDGRPVTDSRFYMWRALFAFAFSDDVLSDAEKRLLKNYQETIFFSPAQLAVLRDDFAHPKNPEEMYRQIADHHDRLRFCALARALMWSDGDPARQEAEILKRVGCLGDDDHVHVLRESRDYPHMHAYYDQYRAAGTLGFLGQSHTLVRHA